MAFTVTYGPSAASVGSLGALISSGQGRRENAQMENDFARQTLGVLLQDRNAQNQNNLAIAGMLNNEAARAWQHERHNPRRPGVAGCSQPVLRQQVFSGADMYSSHC